MSAVKKYILNQPFLLSLNLNTTAKFLTVSLGKGNLIFFVWAVQKIISGGLVSKIINSRVSISKNENIDHRV